MEAAATPAASSAPAELPRAFGSERTPGRSELLAAPLRGGPRPGVLETPLTSLRGIGPKLAAACDEQLGLRTLGDLLWHLPHSYRDPTDVIEIGALRIGEKGTISVEVREARLRPTRRRGLRIVEATVADSSGSTEAIWFNQAWIVDKLTPGAKLLLQGSLNNRGFQVSAYELLNAAGAERGPAGLHTTGVVAVHPASEGIRAQRLREWAWQAMPLARHALEPLPAHLRLSRGLPSAGDALSAAHFPKSGTDAEIARARLAFEELLLYQATLAQRRAARAEARPGVTLSPPGELTREWTGSLPFELTGDQRRAFVQLDADLGKAQPMQRLLMGEVGSGKTVVALYAMLRAVESGHQAALMAPTETLAEQHFATLQTLLAGSPLPAALLTGSTSPPARREILGHLAGGELGLLVGTHALIEDDLRFRSLAVAVVDEQHRFGVRQRAALDAKGAGETAPHAPHTLHMTATPIPRTLSLTAYGDLDTTALHELPAGRRSVETWVVGEEKRAGAYEFVRERLREGRQAYVVCPLVTESDKLQARAATAEGKRLAETEFRDFEVGIVHGQMKSAEKSAAMKAFAAGGTDLLVATSVIEVGIDVPNSTVIVVEDADRYGLSQLHQLRGRVGRGEHPSSCILFAEAGSEAARVRLQAIAAERDGFRLAEVDLALRGEGEILGTRQHGLPRFRAAQLPEDTALLLEAREALIEMLGEDASMQSPQLAPILDAARARFGDERVEALSA